MTQARGMHWNLGGWLGCQLGGSCWILVAGLLAIPANLTVALIVIGLFVLGNVIGFLIWHQRDSLSPNKGVQILLPLLGIIGVTAVFVLDRAGIYESIQTGGSVSAELTYVALIVVISALMLMFWMMDKRR